MELTLPALGILPGAPVYSAEAQARLQARLAELGPDYVPRTELLDDDGRPRFSNRLLLEDAPYLLQHAHNPVDWYPWGEAAFARARAENKPIFLSIGYATCHWCHVMERESFDNPEIATLLNRHFIAVKVDRERHPAVDSVYMTALLVRSGHGGWPMSSFLTPSGQPFFNGTYYPPETFAKLLSEAHNAWQQHRADLEAQAAHLRDSVAEIMAARAQARDLGSHSLARAVARILGFYDARLGGFGSGQKFPQEPWLMLLLEEYQRHADPRLGQVLHTTLDAIMNGGIHDQVGGGFHRYSVDPEWLVPHFEKMLYNQAQLARVYLRAWRIGGNPLYARTARLALDYVLRDQRDPDGAFYSATDADSAETPGGEVGEGLFFLWTPEQLQAVLDETQAEFAEDLFDVTAYGNFAGRTILHLPEALPAYARRYGLPLDYLLQQLDAVRAKLYAARQQRPLPLCDNKVISAWNGLLITALAEAAVEFAEPIYLDAARQAAASLWQTQWDGARLWRVRMGARPSVPGTLQDYAMFAEALLALYDADPGGPWLARAETLARAMQAQFRDPEQGGFFLNPADDVLLMLRPKDAADEAIPAANAVALRVLGMLAARTGGQEYEQQAQALIRAFAGGIDRQPESFAFLLLAAGELQHGEQGPVRYAARGKVRVRARREQGRVTLEITLQDGWHINAHEPLDADLAATCLHGEGLDAVDYPPAQRRTLRQTDMAVYEGTVTLRAKFPRGALELSLQACDDSVCLPPERLRFVFPGEDFEFPAGGGFQL